MKKITREDLIPHWLRKVALEGEDYKNVHKEETLTIPDPGAPGETVRPLTVYLYVSEKMEGAEKKADYAVGYYWKDAGGQDDEFKKTCSSEDEAKTHFTELVDSIKTIHDMTGTSIKKAKEMAKDMFDKHQIISEPTPAVSPGSGSRTQTTFVPGWEVVSQSKKLLVRFSQNFLETALRRFETITDLPAQAPDTVYNTAAKLHCGYDNYVISRWKKTLTQEGNIIRDVIQIEKRTIDEKGNVIEQLRLPYRNVNDRDFNHICTSLTPDQREYGLLYDSVTGHWVKTAKVILQNLFFDSVEELNKYTEEQEKLKGSPTKESLPDLETPKPESKGLEEEVGSGTPSSISFEELMEAEKPSENEVKPTSSLKKSTTKLELSDIKKGDEIVYVSEGEGLKGIVVDVSPKSITLKDVKGEVHEGLEEEGEASEISYFIAPADYAAQLAHEPPPLGLHEEVSVPSEKMESREPAEKTHGVGKPEVAPTGEAEAPSAKEEGWSEDAEEEESELVEETFFRPISHLEITSALKQWLPFPRWKNLVEHNPWMQKVYNTLTENLRSGVPIPESHPSGPTDPTGKGGTPGLTIERGLPGLRAEVKALGRKMQRAEDFLIHEKDLIKLISDYQKEIDDLDSEIQKAKDSKKEKEDIKKLENEREYKRKQQAQRTTELKAVQRKREASWIEPEAFDQALITLFLKYLPMSEVKKEEAEQRSPAEVASGSKKLRDLLQKEKALEKQLQEARAKPFALISEKAEKERELWEAFKTMSDYSDMKKQAEMIAEKIYNLDYIFAQHLKAGLDVESPEVKQYQDIIAKLEKERQQALKGAELPPAEQSKVDALINEIHTLESEVKKKEHWKGVEEVEGKLEELRKEKYDLQEQIGVIASLEVIASVNK